MPDDAIHPSAPGADPATRRDLGLSLWIDLDRTAWRALRAATPNPLSDSDLATLRGLSDDLDVAEVTDVYLPLSRLLNLYVAAEQSLDMAQRTFLGTGSVKVPYVIAVAGSVAVGKSTTARLLQALLARWPDHPRVELVTTDGFLLPNAVLAERGLMARKGFPESYDRAAVVRFLDAVKSGREEINVPVYSHLTYDVVKGATKTIHRPDILVLEGLNLLQTVRQDDGPSSRVYPSDYFDFSIYVDAREDDIRRWYVSRFLRLWETAFRDDKSYFRRFADLSQSEAIETALSIWDEINGPNLVDNIAPTRSRARLVLEKGADHKVQRVRLRKT